MHRCTVNCLLSPTSLWMAYRTVTHASSTVNCLLSPTSLWMAYRTVTHASSTVNCLLSPTSLWVAYRTVTHASSTVNCLLSPTSLWVAYRTVTHASMHCELPAVACCCIYLPNFLQNCLSIALETHPFIITNNTNDTRPVNGPWRQPERPPQHGKKK
jgi:hypothetical protein